MGLPPVTHHGQADNICPSNNLFSSVVIKQRWLLNGGWLNESAMDASTKRGLNSTTKSFNSSLNLHMLWFVTGTNISAETSMTFPDKATDQK